MDYSTITIIGAFIGMLVGMWKIASSFRKDMDSSIERVFKRFDAHKETVDKKLFLLQDINNNSFVRKDNCSLQTDVFKEMFNDIKISLSKLDKKIDIFIGKQIDS